MKNSGIPDLLYIFRIFLQNQSDRGGGLGGPIVLVCDFTLMPSACSNLDYSYPPPGTDLGRGE